MPPTPRVYQVQPCFISLLQACSGLTASTGKLNRRHLPHRASKEPSGRRRIGKEGTTGRLCDLPFMLSGWVPPSRRCAPRAQFARPASQLAESSPLGREVIGPSFLAWFAECAHGHIWTWPKPMSMSLQSEHSRGPGEHIPVGIDALPGIWLVNQCGGEDASPRFGALCTRSLAHCISAMSTLGFGPRVITAGRGALPTTVTSGM